MTFFFKYFFEFLNNNLHFENVYRANLIYLLPSPSMFKRLLETYDEYHFTE